MIDLVSENKTNIFQNVASGSLPIAAVSLPCFIDNVDSFSSSYFGPYNHIIPPLDVGGEGETWLY